MNNTAFHGSTTVHAVFDEGTPVTVQFWTLTDNSNAIGFGVVDGQMKRLDAVGGFLRFEEVA